MSPRAENRGRILALIAALREQLGDCESGEERGEEAGAEVSDAEPGDSMSDVDAYWASRWIEEESCECPDCIGTGYVETGFSNDPENYETEPCPRGCRPVIELQFNDPKIEFGDDDIPF